MRSRWTCRVVLTTLAVGWWNAAGQVATGTYPYGTFDNRGFETINVGNLNVHFSIPVLTKAGRGLPFYYNLSYDSSIWYPSIVNGATTWTPVASFGWKGDTEIATGYTSYSTKSQAFQLPHNEGTCVYIYYLNWQYHDPYGVTHQFYGQTMISSGPPQYCQKAIPTETTGATDGSGYTLNLANYTSATIVGPDSKQFIVPNINNGSATITDSNGNQVSTDGSGHFTDTTGHLVLTVAGSAPSAHTFTYTDTSGNPQKVTMNYQPYTIQTAFGCAIGEYGPTQVYLVSSISLADGSTYQFGYEHTPGSSQNYTGRILTVTLPTGGIITYGYTGGNNGIICTDGSTAGLTRSIATDSGSSASTYSYGRTTGSNTSHTEEVDGLQNHLAFDFVQASNQLTQGGQTGTTTAVYFETNRNVYEGAETGPTFLSRQTCYNSDSPPCTTTAFNLPITQIDTYETLNGIQMHGATAKYNSAGMETESDIYDFGGASSRGPMLSKEVWTYGYSIPGLVTQDELFDGNSNEAGNATYGYDAPGSLTTSSGVPQHIEVSGPRGNLTSWNVNISAQSNSYGGSSTYEDTGSLLTNTVNGATGTLGYDPTFVYGTSGTLPTPSSGVGLGVSETYDTSYTGLPQTTVDMNGNEQTFTYSDPRLRITKTTNPDGGYTSWGYTSVQTSIYSYQNSSSHSDTEMLVDGYGRQSRGAFANGQSSNPWYQVDDCYDANGNLAFQSYRYQGDGWGTAKVCSGAGDSYSYDVLGRLQQVTHSDGTTIKYSYIGRAAEITDENGVTRISQADGLGRATIVCEISSNSSMPGSGSPVSCGTDITGTGFITTYSYAPATGTTTVSQGGQTRTFQTDWLGRPISITEPESGTTTYSYSYDSTGLYVVRTKPKANQTSASVTTTSTTQYDTLGRVVSVSYSDGTPTKTFQYDISNPWGASLQNTKGRMALQGISNAQSIYSYDPIGRIISTGQCTPSKCGSSSYSTAYTYDWLGNILTSSDGAGATDTYTYSVANEVQSITSSVNDSQHPPNLVSNMSNGPFGPLSWNLGNGLSGVRQYDGMGRVSGGWVCSGSSQASCSGGTQLYGFTSSWRGNELTGASDTALNQNNSYGYDEFGRLTSLVVNSGTPGSYTYTYDRWGNRWTQTETNGSGGPQPNLSFNTSKNQVTNSGYGYDAAGNLMNDGAHSYTYDAEGNITQVDSGANANVYTYDALNHRVSTDISGYADEFIFNPMGQHTSDFSVTYGWEDAGWAYWGSSPVAFYRNGTTQFEHQDWLGTERMRTGVNGQPAGSYFSLPFGDAFSPNGNDWDAHHFAGLDQDSSSNEHAQFREYSNVSGRWMSPDLYSGSYDFTNPQSLNRYAYVIHKPLSFTDLSGLDLGDDCDLDPEDPSCCDYGYFGFCIGGGGGGGGGGGNGGGAPTPLPEPQGKWDPNHVLTENLGLPRGMLVFPSDVAGMLQGAFGLQIPGCEFGACGPGPMGFANGIGISSSASLNLIIAQAELAALFAQSKTCSVLVDPNCGKSKSQKLAAAAKKFYCKASPEEKIISSMKFGAAWYGFWFGVTGAAGGEFLEPLGGGIPGAAYGVTVGASIGAASGVLSGSYQAWACSAILGAY